jgi:hypothetical protein
MDLEFTKPLLLSYYHFQGKVSLTAKSKLYNIFISYNKGALHDYDQKKFVTNLVNTSQGLEFTNRLAIILCSFSK